MEAMLLSHTRTRTFDLTSANASFSIKKDIFKIFYYSTVYLVFVYFFQALPFLMQMTQSNPRLFEQYVFMITVLIENCSLTKERFIDSSLARDLIQIW